MSQTRLLSIWLSRLTDPCFPGWNYRRTSIGVDASQTQWRVRRILHLPAVRLEVCYQILLLRYVLILSLGIGFDWQGLPNGSVTVDVGGGFGSQSLSLAKVFKHLTFVIQDLPSVIQDAPKVHMFFPAALKASHTLLQFWEAHLPGAVKSGQVKFQGMYQSLDTVIVYHTKDRERSA